MAVDPYGAFVREVDVRIDGAPDGPLSGLTFAAKDLFDIEGFPTGAGNPTWLATHGVAERTAPVVQRLLDAGARLIGKTHTDEMAFSLNGENHHYGTPTNPAAPDRIPGGSSSGSAVAVASALVDFALGTDTGGSVRLPAAFCGIYGIRPTHGAVPIDGVFPLAPSLDVVGWFTRDAETLRRVGSVLLPSIDVPRPPSRVRVLGDGFRITEPETAAVLNERLDQLSDRLPPIEEVRLPVALFDEWLIHFRAIQFHEVWETHGDWITEAKPEFGPGVKERFDMARTMPIGAVAAARKFRERVKEALAELIPKGTVLVMPSAPCPALPIGMPADQNEASREARLKLLCIAGLAGLPQVSVPAGEVDGVPVGLSFVGAPGEDQNLLAFVSWQRGVVVA
ncbi:MAG: amidase [Pseudomonadota bacterium]